MALELPVFVHALRPAGMDRLVGPAPLQQVLAYPTDVGLAAASVITGSLMQHLPGLRIAFSHGGGTLALLLPRLEQAMSVFPALREQVAASPRAPGARLPPCAERGSPRSRRSRTAPRSRGRRGARAAPRAPADRRPRGRCGGRRDGR